MVLENINLAIGKDSPDKAKDDALKAGSGSKYPNVFPLNFAGGSFYIDSTPDKESVTISHKSGSILKFEPNGDILIQSPKDIKVTAERNITIKAGNSISANGGTTDRSTITVVGDAHLQVQNDLHVEVWGNKYETVNKDYKLNVKGTYAVGAANIETKASGIHKENCYEKVNENTFQTNKVGIPGPDGMGGQIKDVIFGNRVIEMADPRGVFSIISAGDLEFIVAKNMRSTIGLLYTGAVGGGYAQTIGGYMDFQIGGMANFTTGGVFNITSGGIFSVLAPQIYLN